MRWPAGGEMVYLPLVGWLIIYESPQICTSHCTGASPRVATGQVKLQNEVRVGSSESHHCQIHPLLPLAHLLLPPAPHPITPLPSLSTSTSLSVWYHRGPTLAATALA